MSFFSKVVKGIKDSFKPMEKFYNPKFWKETIQDGADYVSGKKAMEYNAEQAEAQRQWEEKMSNTSYQRQVADLRAAGLNPTLGMGNSGAAVPSGASASSSGTGIESLNGLINAIAQIQNSKTSAKSVESQNKLNNTSQLNILDEIRQRGINTASNVERNNAQIEKLKADTQKAIAETENRIYTNAKNQELGLTDLDTGTNRTLGHAIKGEKQVGKNAKLWYEKQTEKNINNYLNKKNEKAQETFNLSIKRYLKNYEYNLLIKAQKNGNFKYQKILAERAKKRGWNK